MVKRGEAIGKTAKVDLTKKVEAAKKVDFSKKMQDSSAKKTDVNTPETVDYATGAVMVDIVSVNDIAVDKSGMPQQYFDMLYSYDGGSIARVAAKLACWPDELRAKYNEIKLQEKRPKEPLRAWSSSGVLSGRRTMRGGPSVGPDNSGANEYMRMLMGGQQGQ